MNTISQARAYTQGRVGRYHTYKCRGCHLKFRAFLRETLPVADRVCAICLADRLHIQSCTAEGIEERE